MSAEAKEPIQLAQVRAGKNTTELGARDEVIETFYWRLSEGSAPEPIRIRPNAIKQRDLERLTSDVAEATARGEQLATLKTHRGKLEGQLFIEDLDDSPYGGESDTKKKLDKLNLKITELESQPSHTTIAARFFMQVIVDWPFTIDGEPVPLTVEGISQLDQFFLVCLREDIQDFLSPENRKKRRKS